MSAAAGHTILFGVMFSGIPLHVYIICRVVFPELYESLVVLCIEEYIEINVFEFMFKNGYIFFHVVRKNHTL